MKKLVTTRAAVATAILALAESTLASEGPEGLGEMHLTGVQLLMGVGALVALGVVIWVVVKFAMK